METKSHILYSLLFTSQSKRFKMYWQLFWLYRHLSLVLVLPQSGFSWKRPSLVLLPGWTKLFYPFPQARSWKKAYMGGSSTQSQISYVCLSSTHQAFSLYLPSHYQQTDTRHSSTRVHLSLGTVQRLKALSYINWPIQLFFKERKSFHRSPSEMQTV